MLILPVEFICSASPFTVTFRQVRGASGVAVNYIVWASSSSTASNDVFNESGWSDGYEEPGGVMDPSYKVQLLSHQQLTKGIC